MSIDDKIECKHDFAAYSGWRISEKEHPLECLGKCLRCQTLVRLKNYELECVYLLINREKNKVRKYDIYHRKE